MSQTLSEARRADWTARHVSALPAPAPYVGCPDAGRPETERAPRLIPVPRGAGDIFPGLARLAARSGFAVLMAAGERDGRVLLAVPIRRDRRDTAGDGIVPRVRAMVARGERRRTVRVYSYTGADDASPLPSRTGVGARGDRPLSRHYRVGLQDMRPAKAGKRSSRTTKYTARVNARRAI